MEARDKPIITMFECIRRKIMTRIQIKKKGMEKYGGSLCPRIQEKLEKFKEQSRDCFPHWSGELEFEVDHFNMTYLVDLNAKTCTCRRWDLSGIPCCHAIAAIGEHHDIPENYVHPYYSKETYLKTYSYMIHPVPGMHDYLVTGYQPLQPPLSKKQTGRPKKLRRRQADEPRNPHLASRRNINVTCAKCLGSGHNRRTCKNRIYPNSSMLKRRGVGMGGFPQSTRASTQPTTNVPQSAASAIHGQPRAMTQPNGKERGGGSGRGRGRGVVNGTGRGRGHGSGRGGGAGNATGRGAGSGAPVCAGNSGGRGGANERV